MARRLPPLNALRAFEAAARHLSISKAADELNVTPAAVSHQVKALEDTLGLSLFRRLNRALMLTDPGQLLLPGLRDGFDALAQAVARIEAEQDHATLTVSVGPSIAAQWLVPRLDRFRRACPDIDLRIDATDRVVDFAREEADVAIRYGAGDYSGLRAELLFTDEIVPVCSVKLCKGPPPLRQPGDLKDHTLLHVEWDTHKDSATNWHMWLLAAGVTDVDATRGPRFSQESMAAQAAIKGHGVALIGSRLVADDLAVGRLVRPFDLSLPSAFATYVVAPESSMTRPKVAAFFDWILQEAGAATRNT
jgi:LysR family transcriptional regulator, glycine cleavage system transcriptional activator